MNAVAPGSHLAFLENMLEENIGKIYCGRGPDERTTDGHWYKWDDPPVVVKPGEMVNHPRHYNAHPSGVECIEIMEHMTCNLGNAFKYGWRYNEKGDPVENLEKMLWYVKRSEEHDSHALFNTAYGEWFRMNVMTPARRKAFGFPSPWAEPVRVALAALCDMHCGVPITERIRLTDKIRRCVNVTIDDLRAEAA